MRRYEIEDGFSLVELLVALLISSVVAGTVGTIIVTGLRTQTNTTLRLDALHELEVASQRATRDLRAASPIQLSETVPATDQIGARITRDGRQSIVVYRLEVTPDGEQHLVQIERAGASDQANRTLVTRVDNADDQPFLTYFGPDGSELECPAEPPTDPDDPDQVASYVSACRQTFLTATSVELRLVRAADPDRPPVTVSTNVSIRSIRFGGEDR